METNIKEKALKDIEQEILKINAPEYSVTSSEDNAEYQKIIFLIKEVHGLSDVFMDIYLDKTVGEDGNLGINLINDANGNPSISFDYYFNSSVDLSREQMSDIAQRVVSDMFFRGLYEHIKQTN